MKAIVNWYRKNKVPTPRVEIRNSFGNKGDDEGYFQKAVSPVVKRNAISKHLNTGVVFSPEHYRPSAKVVPEVNKRAVQLIPNAKGKPKATFLKPANKMGRVFGDPITKKSKFI